MLLADGSLDWPYAFVHMNDTMSHVPLSDKGHIGTMADGIHTANACSWFHQLQVRKLMQHSDCLAFPEGLNRELEALQFRAATLKMSPLWMDLPKIHP